VDVKGSAEQALVRYDFGTGDNRHCKEELEQALPG
jgi:hypothetical protein